MNHSTMIDFLIVSFKRIEYIELAVHSIHKYVNNPYKITVIDNGNEVQELTDLFKDDDLVDVIKGPQNGIWEKPGDGSKNHSAALTMGMEHTEGEYICFFDYDAIFLNEWVDDIKELLKSNFLVSYMRYDLNIFRDQFLVIHRKDVDNYNLYPNLDYKDGSGNITYFCSTNDKQTYMLKDSFSDKTLKQLHLLDIENGEQLFLNGEPIFYHYARGGSRNDNLYNKWINVVRRYLNDK